MLDIFDSCRNIEHMKPDHLGNRLNEERLRLGLTQQAFAKLMHVSKSSQSGYEAGTRVPDANYLAIADDAGIDIAYVVTGTRLSTKVAAYFDWEKQSQIIRAIDDWLAKKHLALPHNKKMELVRVFYDHFQNTDKIEVSTVDPILSLVA